MRLNAATLRQKPWQKLHKVKEKNKSQTTVNMLSCVLGGQLMCKVWLMVFIHSVSSHTCCVEWQHTFTQKHFLCPVFVLAGLFPDCSVVVWPLVLPTRHESTRTISLSLSSCLLYSFPSLYIHNAAVCNACVVQIYVLYALGSYHSFQFWTQYSVWTEVWCGSPGQQWWSRRGS